MTARPRETARFTACTGWVGPPRDRARPRAPYRGRRAVAQSWSPRSVTDRATDPQGRQDQDVLNGLISKATTHPVMALVLAHSENDARTELTESQRTPAVLAAGPFRSGKPSLPVDIPLTSALPTTADLR